MAQRFTKQELLDYMGQISGQFGVPGALASGVLGAESSWGENRINGVPGGGGGPMQIIPSTARAYGFQGDVHQMDDSTNVRMGMQLLADNYRMFGGDWDKALRAYNRGTDPGAMYDSEGDQYVYNVRAAAGLPTLESLGAANQPIPSMRAAHEPVAGSRTRPDMSPRARFRRGLEEIGIQGGDFGRWMGEKASNIGQGLAGIVMGAGDVMSHKPPMSMLYGTPAAAKQLQGTAAGINQWWETDPTAPAGPSPSPASEPQYALRVEEGKQTNPQGGIAALLGLRDQKAAFDTYYGDYAKLKAQEFARSRGAQAEAEIGLNRALGEMPPENEWGMYPQIEEPGVPGQGDQFTARLLAGVGAAFTGDRGFERMLEMGLQGKEQERRRAQEKNQLYKTEAGMRAKEKREGIAARDLERLTGEATKAKDTYQQIALLKGEYQRAVDEGNVEAQRKLTYALASSGTLGKLLKDGGHGIDPEPLDALDVDKQIGEIDQEIMKASDKKAAKRLVGGSQTQGIARAILLDRRAALLAQPQKQDTGFSQPYERLMAGVTLPTGESAFNSQEMAQSLLRYAAQSAKLWAQRGDREAAQFIAEHPELFPEMFERVDK